MKVAYGTTSTTKRSIPDNTYVPSLTTIATPPLTTLRYSEKSPHQQQLNLHHRNYELDLERDHALPTSAPNADILKSNSNPTYPNPNRHHNHDRDRHRHLINSTPAPSIHNLLNKGQPTIAMYPGDMPSYSPPARAFFTPPLPPEYQNPFADKPTLRGTNNDGGIITPGNNNNQQSYINRRPIPPPSLMPGHERIPFRPPELSPGSSSNINVNPKQSSSELSNSNIGGRGVNINGNNNSGGVSLFTSKTIDDPNQLQQQQQQLKIQQQQQQRKKTLNTPSQKLNNNKIDSINEYNINSDNGMTNVVQLNNGGSGGSDTTANVNISGDRVPNISRILSGSNGKKGDIPEVLLKQNNRNKDNRGVLYGPSTSTKDGISLLDEFSDENDEEDDDDFGDDTNGEVIASTGNNNDKKHKEKDEPKTQLTIKINSKSTSNPYIVTGSSSGINSNNNTLENGEISNNTNNNNYNNGNVLQNGYSTEIIHNLADGKSFVHLTTSIPSNGDSLYQAAAAAKETKKSNIGPSTSTIQNNAAATWDIAWNIHVYLSVILFTMLGVYSIFKMIFYNKLSHLFSQSYFVWIHLILITICISRIFYLIYDAYNIHSSFPIFISELLLNLPATFLTIAFSILILFLLIRSLNHKTNRYSTLIRPLTVLVGSLVHVLLCVILHLVESYTTAQNSHLHYYYQQQHQQQAQQQQQQHTPQQQQQFRNNVNVGNTNLIKNVVASNSGGIPVTIPPPPPRVLSLICQIIYIFVCLSLGLLYLYIYRILKRVLRSKSQNYIHGYQNLSYAIHITIATALLFVLLAALQIFGAISISTARTINITTGGSEVDWLQWGYQFSLRLIEIAIIWLMSWVAGLKTGGTPGVLQREKNIGGTSSGSSHENHHNISGFALFPCTSSSSQEHFETDYPAVCNANTNLHTYTLRTGKPIYDDNFALNSLQNSNNSGGANPLVTAVGVANTGVTNNENLVGGVPHLNDFQQQQQQSQQQSHSDFVRTYETSSLRSGRHSVSHSQIGSDLLCGGNNDSTTDHYENPNFELRGSKLHYSTAGGGSNLDNCYSEPLNIPNSNNNNNNNNSSTNRKISYDQSYDFQNLERPNFQSERIHSRLIDYNISCSSGLNHKSKHSNTKLDRSSYENPERRSSNSAHSCMNSLGARCNSGAGVNDMDCGGGHGEDDDPGDEDIDGDSDRDLGGCGGGGGDISASVGGGGQYISNGNSRRGYAQYNSFDRRNCGVRKSGTLNNIGAGVNTANSTHIHGRNGSTSSSTSSHSHHRPSGVQTLSLSHRSSNSGGSGRMNSKGNNSNFYRGINSRSSLEGANTITGNSGSGVGGGCSGIGGGPGSGNSSSSNGVVGVSNGIVNGNSIYNHYPQLSSSQQQQQQQPHEQQQQQAQYTLQSDEEILLISNNQAERTNLINGHCSGNSSGNDITGCITMSTSENLTDITTPNSLIIGCNNDITSMKQQQKHQQQRQQQQYFHHNNGIVSTNTINGNSNNSNNTIVNGDTGSICGNCISNGGNGGCGDSDGGGCAGGGSSSISGDSVNSGSMLVAEHGFVRFRALDDINNAQGVGIHNASIRTTGRSKEKRYTNKT
ncbi:probable cyclin-dependent serine/threonine-protein kinase DDB_G0292550 isoform X3 [Condylostylus longicornis]|uniref:probable cyclin-dependent serine/threonine-protein kinase DDB_G0292550 isoform X3 n=1 Tax=Condylostylus longicornis TaxID=2530218 RepID=UPI00244DA996|nr:probable cyclin-dependent serine/threonine-protein kinase DDB_G0292550 isoform X3 [Condylostylus longicornis]